MLTVLFKVHELGVPFFTHDRRPLGFGQRVTDHELARSLPHVKVNNKGVSNY